MSTATATATATASAPACCCSTHERKELVFYYTKTAKTSEFVYTTNPATYSGMETFQLTNKDGVALNNQVISYWNSRIPGDIDANIAARFYEVLMINVSENGDNFVQASANYVDLGSGSNTTVDSNLFAVSAGTGMFKDAKTIVVEYNNVTLTRKVIVRNY